MRWPFGVVLFLFALASSEACPGAAEDRSCFESGEEVPLTSLLQLQRRLHHRSPLAVGREGSKQPANVSAPLSFAHVPCNFGHSVELFALGELQDDAAIYLSDFAPTYGEQLWIMDNLAKAPDGVLWGMMHPITRPIDNTTGCNLYYTPGYLWPQEAADAYFARNTVFAFLRDPYDKMVNEFRQQVGGVDSAYLMLTRAEVSAREGHMERENATYQEWYDTCDVNKYLQAELGFYLQGGAQRFRDNCHLLPQSEYLQQPYGATVFMDVRKIPDSFNDLMEAHGYPYQMTGEIHNTMCNNLSAWSLTEETKALIREVYADDFNLLCEQFGYCDDRELTCLEQIPDMCGGKPGSPPPNSTVATEYWWGNATDAAAIVPTLIADFGWTGLNFSSWFT